MVLRLGVWISDVSAPLVSPRGHRPVTQVERHLTGNEIRPAEGACRADRKERLGYKAVCVADSFYPPAARADSLLCVFLLGQEKKTRGRGGREQQTLKKTTADNMMVFHR